jgi:hypothetical protein
MFCKDLKRTKREVNIEEERIMTLHPGGKKGVNILKRI